MKPLYVYLTRPDSYLYYVGGDAHLRIWLTEPHYSHQPLMADVNVYHDHGWKSRADGQTAKTFLKQDPALHAEVMKAVVTSLIPKGMDYEECDGWFAEGKWDSLTDGDWEAKCNTSHKRFLLKIELRTGTVERIDPQVMMEGKELHRTSDIDPVLATQVYHTDTGSAIPF